MPIHPQTDVGRPIKGRCLGIDLNPANALANNTAARWFKAHLMLLSCQFSGTARGKGADAQLENSERSDDK